MRSSTTPPTTPAITPILSPEEGSSEFNASTGACGTTVRGGGGAVGGGCAGRTETHTSGRSPSRALLMMIVAR
eukprot:4832483-Pleurochrysis_carterae.AAC.1